MDITRKLASIRTISDIQPIPGADKIVCLSIDGWKVVSQKDNFSIGDWCVFFEVDSFLPIESRYEFLRKGCYKNHPDLGEGFRLKTIKLRNQVSQGLALPLSEFFKKDSRTFQWYYDYSLTSDWIKENDDLTELLNIKKWEPPLPKSGGFASGKAKSNFPDFIPKTNQERIQNVYKYLSPDVYEVTVKLDGTSMTVYHKDGKIGVCSRNFELELDEPSAYTNTVKDNFIIDNLQIAGLNIAVQGELMGPGIQGNKEKLDKLTFFVYDIWDITNQKYFTPTERQIFCNRYGFKHVPVWEDFIEINIDKISLDDLLYLAEGPSINPDTEREGLVFKNQRGDFSFKVISNKFLLADK